MVANHSDVISRGDSDGSIDLGILGEILEPDGSYLDTDSEFEYDEEYNTFVKSSRFEHEELLLRSATSARQIDAFYHTSAESFRVQEDGLENCTFSVSKYDLKELI